MEFFSGVTCVQCKKEVPGNRVYKIDDKYICNKCYNPDLHKPQVRPLFDELTHTLLFPFTGTNLAVVITGSVFFALVKRFASSWLVWLVVGTLPFVYLCGYLMDIIANTAEEKEEVPELPDLSIHSFFMPLVKTLSALVVSSTLFAVYVFIIQRGSPPDIIGIFLFVLGWVYFPMALASTSIAHTVPDAILKTSPHVVVPLIIKGIIEYLIAWGVTSSLALMNVFLHKIFEGSTTIVGEIIIMTISFYSLIMGTWIVGLVFGRNKRKIDAEYPGILYKIPPYKKK